MPLLRAFVCLVLALTLVGTPVAHAHTIGATLATESHHGDHAAATATVHVTHDCDDLSRRHPAQDADVCQMACCFMPAQLPARADAATAAEFRLVSYDITTQVLTDRACAPDPEIPKRS